MSFNIYCQLGLLMLIGLTAKTAILMVEYSKQERDAGQSVSDAALNGMRLRFRSVMMTALSFVIGVFPMVFASGARGGQPAGDRYYDLLGHAGGDDRRHDVHPGSLRRIPAYCGGNRPFLRQKSLTQPF